MGIRAGAIATVSPSTRLELRRRLGFLGSIFVVPNGTINVPTLSGSRDPDPTIVVVSRLVPHKRIDLLLGEIAVAARTIPRLRVDIVGDGPERSRLQSIASIWDCRPPSLFTVTSPTRHATSCSAGRG